MSNPQNHNGEPPKVALLSESPADEMAIRALVEAALGRRIIRVQPSLRARGWPNVMQVMPAILRHLHFNTDTMALVVVVDSDETVVHTEEHEKPDYFHPRCRMCQLRAVYRRTVKNLPPSHGRKRVLRAIGIAVPAVEAWYLCGRDDSVGELRWIHGLETERLPYTRAELKQRVYGTNRPSLAHEIECALREVNRQKHDLRRLESDFPNFAALVHDIRSWEAVR